LTLVKEKKYFIKTDIVVEIIVLFIIKLAQTFNFKIIRDFFILTFFKYIHTCYLHKFLFKKIYLNIIIKSTIVKFYENFIKI